MSLLIFSQRNYYAFYPWQSLYSSACLSVCLSAYRSRSLSPCMCGYIPSSVRSFLYLPVRVSIPVEIRQLFSPSVYISVSACLLHSLSVLLYVCPSPCAINNADCERVLPGTTSVCLVAGVVKAVVAQSIIGTYRLLLGLHAGRQKGGLLPFRPFPFRRT